MSFLNKYRNSTTNSAAAFENLNKSGGYQAPTDEWKLTIAADKSGSAVIRLLPDVRNDLPLIRWWEHYFRGPSGKYYNEKSLTTLGQPDPVSELNSTLWNSTDDDNSDERKQARNQKRKLVYVSNVLVIKDPAKPETVGKVYKWKYAKKLFDIITSVLMDEENPIDVFDPEHGANLNLVSSNQGGFVSYDKSRFGQPGPICKGNEKEIEAILGQTHDLAAIIDPSQFKSYDVLKAKLHDVLGVSQRQHGLSDAGQTVLASKTAAAFQAASDDEDDYAKFQRFADDMK